MMRMHRLFRRGVGLLAVLAIFHVCSSLEAQTFFQESFETDGDGTRYILTEPDFAFSGDSGPAMWGHNFDAEQIGLIQNAPARRAAILWQHDNLEDDYTPESLEVWTSLANWAVDDKAGATIAFFPGFEFSEGSAAVADALQAAGHNVEEIFDPLEADPATHDLVIHSSEQASTAFAETPVPIISYSGSDHDDTAIAGIGAQLTFFDEVVLTVPAEHVGHPALGGKEGPIPWTNAGVPLQGIGKLHNGGKAIAWTEHPDTEDPTPAIFVIEEGDPLLGAFNPDPEGDGYIVGAAINKLPIPDERQLILGPINVEGKSDVMMTVALAATAADFENGDYLRIEIDPDDDGPRQPIILEEFFGVDDDQSDCHKGMSNGEFAGEVGEICLPEDRFEDFSWPIPADATDVTLTFAVLSTWGNEIFGIDNVRFSEGPPTSVKTGDYNGDGVLDAADIDLQAAAMNDPAPNLGTFDENGDGRVDIADRTIWVNGHRNTWFGDSNLDGEFGSGDLVAVFTAGKFETGDAASWGEGDWNGDGVFGSGDLVAAFTEGGFEQGPRPQAAAIPEPSAVTLALFGVALIVSRWRRSHC